MMPEEKALKEAMIQHFGRMIERDWDVLYNRICLVIAAKMYAGNQGDTLLAQTNQFFEKYERN